MFITPARLAPCLHEDASRHTRSILAAVNLTPLTVVAGKAPLTDRVEKPLGLQAPGLYGGFGEVTLREESSELAKEYSRSRVSEGRVKFRYFLLTVAAAP